MTKTYGVIGDPISHSLSPIIHNGWIKDYSLNAKYEAFFVPAEQFDEGFAKLHDSGVVGLNVTLPHKAAAAKVGTCTELVQYLGVANTLSRGDDDCWQADNTDVEGFREDLKIFLQTANWEGLPVTLLGAGGSAKSVLYVLDIAGASITVANRTIEKAEAMLTGLKGKNHKCKSFEEGLRTIDLQGLVINCTSIGYGNESLELPISRGGFFYDLSYGKVAERIVNEAREKGWKVRDGLGMLVGQAAASFRTWFSKRPDVKVAMEKCCEVLGRQE